MVIISTTRHTRKQGVNVRLVTFDTAAEESAICSSNVTTQAISKEATGALIAWGDWNRFKTSLTERGYNVQGE